LTFRRIAVFLLGWAVVAEAAAYIDSTVCSSCHPAIAKRYAQTGMANSVRPVGEATPIEIDAQYRHEPSQKTYDVSRTTQRRTNSLGDAYELAVTHTIGSGKNGRSYAHRAANGELTQLPLSWYTQERRWDMSPGYEGANHADFARPVERGCLFCHTAATQKLDGGVDCQRCHGPGGDHAKAPTRTNITRYGGQDTCLQCHLQSTSDPLPHAVLRVGRSLWSYRPGEPLSEYAVHFQEPEQTRKTKFEINSHGYRLHQSPCLKESDGKLECIRCHDAHGEVALTSVRERTRAVCISCHQPHREEARNECSSCHMPRRQAQDAPHVTMTDHLISLRPPVAAAKPPLGPRGIELLNAVGEPDLYLGLAYLRGGSNIGRGIELLRRIPVLPKEAKLALIAANALAPDAVTPAGAEEELTVGQALLQNGQIRQADAHLRRALPLPKARMALAYIAVRDGNMADALAWWRSAAESSPVRAEALTNSSRFQLEAGNTAGALQDARKATSFEPNSAEANLAYSRALAATGALDAALQRGARAVQLDGNHADARYHYGRLLHAAGDTQSAIKQYNTSLKLNAASYAAELSLGIALAQTGNRSGAAEHFRKALELKPDLEEAKRNLRLVNPEGTPLGAGRAASGEVGSSNRERGPSTGKLRPEAPKTPRGR
jgi:predicted CXXCH cytochrome family protein